MLYFLLFDLIHKKFDFPKLPIYLIFVFFFISCLCCLFLYNSINYVKGLPVSELKIINFSLVEDMNHFTHLIGYAENYGNFTLKDILINANIRDLKNLSIGNYSKQTELQFLNPKELSPFDIMIFDKQFDNNIKKFDFTNDYDITKYHPKNIKLTSSLSRLDFTGYYYISGKVKNYGISPSNNTIIIAVVKDKDNKMLGIWKAQTEPYNIPPNGLASFTIPVTDKTQSFKISKYSLFIN